MMIFWPILGAVYPAQLCVRVHILPSSGQTPLHAACGGELGQSPCGYMPVCVWDEVRERPNLSVCVCVCVCVRERSLVGSAETHVVTGQLLPPQSCWGGGWRGQSAGCCLLWLWPELRPASRDSYCGEMTQLWMSQGKSLHNNLSKSTISLSFRPLYLTDRKT